MKKDVVLIRESPQIFGGGLRAGAAGADGTFLEANLQPPAQRWALLSKSYGHATCRNDDGGQTASQTQRA